MCREFGWTADQITGHYEAHALGYASNHGYPASWIKHFDDSMDKFRARVQTLRRGAEAPVVEEKEIPAESPVAAEKADAGVKTVNVELNTLRSGNRGNQVKTAQRLLNALGYDCGNVDGVFGAKTKAAVMSFQKAKGLGADGIIGSKTWNALLK